MLKVAGDNGSMKTSLVRISCWEKTQGNSTKNENTNKEYMVN